MLHEPGRVRRVDPQAQRVERGEVREDGGGDRRDAVRGGRLGGRPRTSTNGRVTSSPRKRIPATAHPPVGRSMRRFGPVQRVGARVDAAERRRGTRRRTTTSPTRPASSASPEASWPHEPRVVVPLAEPGRDPRQSRPGQLRQQVVHGRTLPDDAGVVLSVGSGTGWQHGPMTPIGAPSRGREAARAGRRRRQGRARVAATVAGVQRLRGRRWPPTAPRRSPASASTDPDVVIMDVMMPRLDGIETTRALRTAKNDVPILVLTARDAVGDRVEGLDAGRRRLPDQAVRPAGAAGPAARAAAPGRAGRGRRRRGARLRRPDDGPRDPRGHAAATARSR